MPLRIGALVWMVLTVMVVFAEEPAKADLKKAVVGKWVSMDRDRAPLEIRADGTITVPFHLKDGVWVTAEGTYTVDEKGEIRYRAASGGATLSGWYKFKDGMLTSAMGAKLNVRWKKVEEQKKPADKD